MKHLSIFSIGTAIAVAALGVIAVTPAASATGGQDTVGGKEVGNVASTAAAQTTAAAMAVVTYWTPERMASAKPVDLSSKTDLLDGGAAQAAPDTTVTGQKSKASGTVGNLNAVTATAEAARLAGTSTADPVARPYTSLPNRLNGKVFFSKNGGNYVCSGTLVNSTNKDMVDTAGQCVATGAGAWVTNWAFVPAYSSSYWGQAPYGVWPARTLATTGEWFYNGNFKQDYGYGVLGVQYGTHIVDWLGGQGTLFNYSRSQLIYEFGYPQVYPYNGYDQRLNVSWTFGADDPNPGRSGPATFTIWSPQTGGTSGGGWIAYLSDNGLGYVNSHSSYRYVSGPKANPYQLYGPYYGSQLQSLYYFAAAL